MENFEINDQTALPRRDKDYRGNRSMKRRKFELLEKILDHIAVHCSMNYFHRPMSKCSHRITTNLPNFHFRFLIPSEKKIDRTTSRFTGPSKSCPCSTCEEEWDANLHRATIGLWNLSNLMHRTLNREQYQVTHFLWSHKFQADLIDSIPIPKSTLYSEFNTNPSDIISLCRSSTKTSKH